MPDFFQTNHLAVSGSMVLSAANTKLSYSMALIQYKDGILPV